ncbi:MAG TPA: alpha/beta fold hydrolase [Edaphobacter sp.]|nr:alpha/beta fold hydrolase [Edaphobacter sp.]
MIFFLSVLVGLFCSVVAPPTSKAEVTPQSTGIVHTADTDLSYEQFGHDAGKTPAIIVNGGPGFSHTYMYLTDVFTKKFSQNRSVIFYDQRGIGKSKLLRASAPEGLEAQVADLEALRVRLGYNRIDLIGHSWGGLLSMAYAAAYPQRIQHLVLIDSAGPNWYKSRYLFEEVFPDQLANEDEIAKGNDAAAKSSGELLRRFLARDFYSQERFQELIGKLSSEELAKVNNQNIDDAVQDALKNRDLTDDLKRFTFPTLVMWGRYDINSAVVTGWKISQAVPGAKIVIYEKTRHFPFYEEESSFLHDLNQFLSDTSGSTH